MRISDIHHIILEIFIAEARLRCPESIVIRLKGNRMSWPQQNVDPRQGLTAKVQETFRLYLNPRCSKTVGTPGQVCQSKGKPR